MPPSMDAEQGLALIPRLSGVPVVVLTGHAEHDLALRAAELGAWDFLAKPLDPDLLRFVVMRALRKRRLDAELIRLRQQQGEESMGLVGQAPALQALRSMIRRVAGTRVNVLVLGPTGTGKELVARALHERSAHAAAPFVPVHCGALSADLLESELFGDMKGSFTGAYRDQPGLVEVARGGTLFLDEVGEMPPPMQVKLLRFLQEGSYMPVGGRVTQTSEVRVVAATHRDLEAMVHSGEFREDLYYRLKGVVLRTPPLADRRQDVPVLAARFAQQRGVGVSASALAWLSTRDWPGNVRELKAVVEAGAALLLPGQHELDADTLSLATGEAPAPRAMAGTAAEEHGGLLDQALTELERRLISEAMHGAGGNQSEAARRLGISRVGLIKKLTRLGLKEPRNDDQRDAR
ncbi:MAG: sigma-54 dependent transcriptional regulator [Ramlibacter sp.]